MPSLFPDASDGKIETGFTAARWEKRRAVGGKVGQAGARLAQLDFDGGAIRESDKTRPFSTGEFTLFRNKFRQGIRMADVIAILDIPGPNGF